MLKVGAAIVWMDGVEIGMPRQSIVDDAGMAEEAREHHWPGWGRSPYPLLMVGLALAVLAASLGVSWLVEGIKSAADVSGPHQQWKGVVVQHQEGDLLFTGLVVQHALVVGFIDQHDPGATFTVQVDADTYSAIPDGMLISLDLGPHTGHVYALATSHDGVAWNRQELDPGGNHLLLDCWLLLPFGGLLALLGLLGLALAALGLADLLRGTEVVSGVVVDVIEGTFLRLPRVVVDGGAGPLELLALRRSVYERICEDGGRSQMTFVVSHLLRHVRRARRHRSSRKLGGAGNQNEHISKLTSDRPGNLPKNLEDTRRYQNDLNNRTGKVIPPR